MSHRQFLYHDSDGIPRWHDEHQLRKTRARWPIYSEAAAVHPKQAKEWQAYMKSQGVPTEYDYLGRPELRDRGHRRRYLRAARLHDKDGGYGDG
jgi:hypothetical protein